MALRYRIDVISALKEMGWSVKLNREMNARAAAENKALKERGEIIVVPGWLSEDTVSRLRKNQPISWNSLETLCRLLHCQPGDLLCFMDDDRPVER